MSQHPATPAAFAAMDAETTYRRDAVARDLAAARLRRRQRRAARLARATASERLLDSVAADLRTLRDRT